MIGKRGNKGHVAFEIYKMKLTLTFVTMDAEVLHRTGESRSLLFGVFRFGVYSSGLKSSSGLEFILQKKEEPPCCTYHK